MTDSKYLLFSRQWLVERYLRYGSVEESINNYDDHFPVSIADYHRKIKKFGVVKRTGRGKVSIAKTLYFFAQKAVDPSIPIERLYKKMPVSFKENASIATLHRIYNNAMDKVVRLKAAGIIVTPEGMPDRVLIADEIESRPSSGKNKGDSSILFSFANKNEPFNQSVLRVLQQEFSTKLTTDRELTIGSKLAKKLAPSNIKPFMHFHILDIELNVFHVEVPVEFCKQRNLSSFKVKNHRFINIKDAINKHDSRFRVGVPEILDIYRTHVYAHNTASTKAKTITSRLNSALAVPAKVGVPSQK